MLQQLRRGASSLVAKILLGLLVLSFGLWGIGDIFRNYGGQHVASVGGTDVSIEAFRRDYDQQRQQLARRAGKPVSNEQAEALGLRSRVLGQLVTAATFDEQARRMMLNVSKSMVVHDVMQDPAFAGPTGTFDRMKFERLLYGSNYNEAMYMAERMQLAKRRMLALGLTAGVTLPDMYKAAIHRLKSETRSVDYIVLTAERFAKVALPGETELAKYYDVVKAAYNTVERRSLNLLTVKAEDFAKNIEVSDADARAAYDTEIDKFSKPERREIEQVIFPDETTAQMIGLPPKAAVIDTLVAENKVTHNSLGLLARKDVIDPAVAEAAFSLPLNTYSNLVKGQFGPIVVRVTKIERGEVVPFEKAKAGIKQGIALVRARDALFDMHDKIENERASGARLDEIATKLKLQVASTPAVDRQGLTESGKPSGIEPAVLEDAFAAEQGVDNEPIQLPNQNWIWFEVDKIDAERERPLAEVRSQVEEQWLTNQRRVALSEKAHGILEEIKKGKSLDIIARETGVALKSTKPFGRDAKDTELSQSAVNTAFRIAVREAETGLAADNKDRIVFVVKSSNVPQPVQVDDKLIETVTDGMRDELLYQFIAGVQQNAGLTVNNELAARLTAGTQQ